MQKAILKKIGAEESELVRRLKGQEEENIRKLIENCTTEEGLR